MVKIAPSVLSLDFTDFNRQMEEINKHADWIHFDVMDGHFVPNISYGPKILEDVKKASDLFCDVHIMVSNPYDVTKWFMDAGADLVTFHHEALKDLEEAQTIIKMLHDNDRKAGVSIKPKTTVKEIESYVSDLDLVLVMSVEPGFGGQSFMPEVLEKVKELVALREKNNYHYVIEIDGGINEETAKLAKAAGVDVLVAGSYVFNGDIEAKINSLR